jgi:predicted dehydrogenase
MAGLRIGVVGLGLGRHHVAAYLASSDVGEIKVCDPNPSAIDAVLRVGSRVVAGYADLDAMLGDGPLDAVSIVTPDHLHRPHAVACLRAGCHVLLTKPLATDLIDAMHIVAQAEQARLKLMVAQECRFRSRFRRLKALIDAGTFGEIINLRIDSIWDKRAQFARAPWYADKATGRSVVVGTAIHEIDLLRHLIGRPILRVQAVGNALGPLDFHAEKNVAALFEFEGGAIGQVTVSYAARFPPAGEAEDPLRLIGTRGIAVGDRFASDDDHEWRSLPVDETPHIVGTHACVTAFVDAIVRDVSVPVDGRDAMASLAACIAVDEAVRSGIRQVLR